MYAINEILEFESNEDGILHCVFRIEGDDPKTVRVISDGTYYTWASNQEESRGYYISSILNESDDDSGEFNSEFDFQSWKEDNESEEIIIDFIYENYQVDDLPESEKIKKSR
jgi:hypothetical protein